MDAGERDRVVTIQQRSAAEVVDDAGAPVETWTTLVAQMPATRVDLSGREAYRMNQLTGPMDTRWEINYRVDMDPELLDVPKLRRLLAGGRVHDIVAASVIGRRDGIELMTLASSAVTS